MQDSIGLKIKRLRNANLMTQEQLSESSGVSVRTIRRLEAGENVEGELPYFRFSLHLALHCKSLKT